MHCFLAVESPADDGLSTTEIVLIAVCSVIACVILILLGLFAFSIVMRREIRSLVCRRHTFTLFIYTSIHRAGGLAAPFSPN
jgi:hypothetical protein